jgi:hypothetical protein
VEDEEPVIAQNTDDQNTEERSHTHTEQPEFHKEPLRAVEPHRLLMHGTNSRSRTVIPCTNSGFGAKILREPRANSEPRATKEPRADSEIDSKPRAMNSNGNAEGMDPERDLQIASGLNGQSIDLRNRHAPRLRRTLRPTFKV